MKTTSHIRHFDNFDFSITMFYDAYPEYWLSAYWSAERKDVRIQYSNWYDADDAAICPEELEILLNEQVAEISARKIQQYEI